MPFGLRNVGATYQKLVDKVFVDQKGRNIEVYVDNTIVTRKTDRKHIDDLKETFHSLRRENLQDVEENIYFDAQAPRRSSRPRIPNKKLVDFLLTEKSEIMILENSEPTNKL